MTRRNPRPSPSPSPSLAVRSLHRFSTVAMDSWITIQIVSDQPRATIEPAAQAALAWFEQVERAASRFEPDSEIMRLARQPGQTVPVSTLVFELATFAVELARLTDGAFDPAIGASLERRGFDRNYRTGERVRSAAETGTFRDIRLDRRTQTIFLRRPIVLDLNAVAKGLAIDLAARALGETYPDVCVEAGGDLYVRGHNALGEAWHVGIQHPRAEGLLVRTLRLSNTAVCTSGAYERGEHILDARSGQTAGGDLASVSVIAPTAMAADGLSTAALILGRERGLRLLEQQGVAGLMLDADGATFTTPNGVGGMRWDT